MSRTIIIACDGLHALAHAKDQHHAEAAESVHDTVCTHSKVATIPYQLPIEQSHHARGRHIHQKRTHADKQNVTEYVKLRLPGMTTEADKRAPLQEMPNGHNTRASHRDCGSPSRTSDAPIQHENEQGIKNDIEYGSSCQNPHGFDWITRSTNQTRQIESHSGHEHTRQHNVHILTGIGNSIIGSAKQSQNTVHEKIASRNKKKTKDKRQQHTIAQDVFCPFVIFLA